MTEEKTLKAGAIILSSEQKGHVALLFRGKQGDRSFPKGHTDLGEEASDTMVREIKEETGLIVREIEKLPDLEYDHANGGTVSIRMFLVISEDDSLLKLEFPADKIEWIKYTDVIDKLTYENLKQYFSSIIPKIEKSLL